MSEWQWYIMNITIIIFESLLLYFYFFSNKLSFRCHGIKYTLKERGIFLLQAFSSIFCLILIIISNHNQFRQPIWNIIFLIFSSFIILVSYIVSYYFTKHYFYYRNHEKELQLINMKKEKLFSNYQNVENTQQKVFHLYHDLKKHLNVLNIMENKSEIHDYIEKCFQDLRDIEGKFLTGNPYIDMILYDEWKKAQDLGIKVQFAVEKGSLDMFELYDIIVILGNTLENAREACKKIIDLGENAYIQLKIMKVAKQVICVISNSYTGEIIKKNNAFITSKKNKNLHGIGIKNIHSSIEKYQGSMHVSLKKQKFILTIMLNL